MVWDASKPDTSTTLRAFPGIQTANNDAIEEGDDSLKIQKLNLADRSKIAPIPDDPAIMPGVNPAIQLYSKEVVTNLPELFMRDTVTAIPTQLTSGGAMGSTSTAVKASSVTFNTASPGALSYTDGQFIVAYAVVNGSNATVSSARNMSNGVKGGTGSYTLSVDADVLLNSNYIVMGTCVEAGASAGRVVQIGALPAPVAGNPTLIPIVVRKNDGATNSSFHIMICGGR